MMMLRQSVRASAKLAPERIALEDSHTSISYAELEMSVDKTARQMRTLNFATLGLLADNAIPWALADLSACAADIPLVPLPLFFSPDQILHVIRDTGLDGLLTDRPQQVAGLLHSAKIDYQIMGVMAGLHLLQIKPVAARVLPAGTVKITYTSGTTGEPKGVCLSGEQIEAVALSLRDASQANAEDRHLCLTPLSTLLENIGGIYVPLLAGARACLPPLREVGLRGASALDVGRMLKAMHKFAASSVIVVPQMLQALLQAKAKGAELPQQLRFVALGGAPVAPRLLQQAERLGIPVFEGYGLSECASVVALNTPQAKLTGSVGRPLPHVRLRFAQDGEIVVDNPGFLGYLGQGAPQAPWPTGDLGYVDEDGFLHITGRKKSMFITSFGRNVAPEWVERELACHPAVAQAAVFGEGKPFNAAVIVRRAGFSNDDIDSAIASANLSLPDYARIASWVAADAPFDTGNGQLTATGRLQRGAIKAAYADAIEHFYQEQTHDVF